jgi:PAS domain S-box-containing protein
LRPFLPIAFGELLDRALERPMGCAGSPAPDGRRRRCGVRATTVRPTGVEKTFKDDEIIVSKTDTRGMLTYVNELFVDISGYPEHELIGKPHNIIRHPDMPRGVFKLLWDTIPKGNELFAYIVNLSADGAHYWVLAHVTPTFGPSGDIVGYHSNRRTAPRSAIERVQPLYQSLLAEERRHDHAPTAIAASTALLQQTLEDSGMTYEQFVWSLNDEKVAA